jgi:hypothetical protein
MGDEPDGLTVETSSPMRSRSRRGAGWSLKVPLLLCALLGLPGAAAAQEPPDTIRADTLRADSLRADSLGVDTLGVGDPSGLDARGDSVSADTIFYNLPRMDAAGPSGWDQGVWSWDRDEILASGAVSLADLFADVPGVIAMLSGDYGTPVALTAFGVGGGRVRIFRDGFEVLPLEGGVADLARIGLGGISLVRLERSLGELVIHMEGLEYEDGRPYSMVEAGTGDLNTNLFRGTFANPTALGGSVALALERADSRGARGDEAGNVTGTWLRYQLHRGDGAGLALDYRRMASESAGEVYASPVTRSDVTVRGRASLAPGVNAEAYWGSSSHTVEDEAPRYALEGGSRSQVGARASLERGGFFAQGAYRRFGGDDLPSGRLDLSVGADVPQVGGFSARLDRASWDGTSTQARGVRGWTRPVLGLSVFGSWESGRQGARTFPLLGTPEPDTLASTDPVADSLEIALDPSFRVTERTTTRYGARWAWRDVALAGARLRIDADSLLPLGFEPDRGEPALAGGIREGWEVWGRLPMPLHGLRLEGSLQQWDEPWSYLPRRTYTGAFVFHDTYFPTGNLELWWTLGVRGHDAMSVRQVVGEELNDEGEVVGPELASVPFYQNWYARLQLRIVTVRIFIGWENFAIRRDLQNLPGRLLPATRAVYGLRWTLWN